MSVALELDHDDSVLSAPYRQIPRHQEHVGLPTQCVKMLRCQGCAGGGSDGGDASLVGGNCVGVSLGDDRLAGLQLGLQVRRSADEQPPARLLRSRQARRLPHVDQLLFPPVVIA